MYVIMESRFKISTNGQETLNKWKGKLVAGCTHFKLKDDWKISLYFKAILNEPGLSGFMKKLSMLHHGWMIISTLQRR